MIIGSYLNWLRAVTVRGVQGGTGHPWHLIGHPNYWYATISFSLFNTERSVYFSLELKDATRLVFCIAIHLVYFQPLNHTTCFFFYGAKKSRRAERTYTISWQTRQNRSLLKIENSLTIQILFVLLGISNDKYSFGAL